jgi:signal transduction histidine kinase/CheY-like chemotaxis protein
VGEQDDRLRSEQIRMLYRGGPIGVLVAGIGAFMLGGMVIYLGAIPKGAIYIWLAVVAADVVSHLLVARAYHHARPAEAGWRPWARVFSIFSLIEGVIWGAAAFTLVAPGATEQQLLVMLVVCAVTTGAVSAFGVYLPAFWAVFLPATAPFALTSVIQGGFVHTAIAGMLLVFIVGMMFIAARHNAIVLEALRLRFANLDLAQDLQRQNRATEEATQAKSRFLAAASHDLRQPVHALGLFVGALRSQELAPVPRQLTDRIEESITALNGLFSELLDISRLDAGIVAPSRSSFALQPLLDMLDRDYRGEADAKGIDLRILPSRAVIDSDPVLLGRVLSNLVSNAVRYTDRGRVVVGCRRGTALRIQVLDTGPGIPEAQVERVFEEFFQLHNAERDRSQGLGLGLAIVRRLARLLDHDIRLTSVVGRGSAFSVSVPMAAATVGAAIGPSAAPEPTSAEGRSSLILVIDDESPIRDGMRSLLESWGHRVVCAPSGAEMVATVADRPERPDLIICDYRLADGETGVEAIQLLRAEYNHDIAAMLITGDTAPDRLNEARQSGFLLLHKPVAISRLRAAVTNLLREADPVVLA